MIQIGYQGYVLDIFYGHCQNNWCQVGTWTPHGNSNQMWKKDGDGIVSKWKNAKLGIHGTYGPSVFKGDGALDGPAASIDEKTTLDYSPLFQGTI